VIKRRSIAGGSFPLQLVPAPGAVGAGYQVAGPMSPVALGLLAPANTPANTPQGRSAAPAAAAAAAAQARRLSAVPVLGSEESYAELEAQAKLKPNSTAAQPPSPGQLLAAAERLAAAQRTPAATAAAAAAGGGRGAIATPLGDEHCTPAAAVGAAGGVGGLQGSAGGGSWLRQRPVDR
jgi:hypothetical protein